MVSAMRLASIHVYPLKGARGIALEASEVLAGGLLHDRRFMIVGPNNRFVTQRERPKLALVSTALAGTHLVVGVPSGEAFEIPLAPNGPRRRVQVWSDAIDATVVESSANAMLSRHLGLECTIVFMPPDVVRTVEAPHGRAGDRVGFADAYPVLVASMASLDDLNTRLDHPIPMDRFRPNLVVEGGVAFEEEAHAGVRVGALTFRTPKRCARCSVTTVDQRTAEVGKEPLRTLAKYRFDANSVNFAMNAIPDGPGTVSVGDDVVYLDHSHS